MTVELLWMTKTVFFTSLLWLPYFLDRVITRGVFPAVLNVKTPETGGSPHSLWAQRAIRAHYNAVENLIIFVPAVLTAHVLSISTPVTQGAVVVYFFARLAHFLAYVFAVPLARSVTFVAGWVCQLAIIASILNWI